MKYFFDTNVISNLVREDKSVDFARFCKSKGVNLGKCEAIDFIHFITAKYYDLEIVSFDGDMDRLEEKYWEFFGSCNS